LGAWGDVGGQDKTCLDSGLKLYRQVVL